ncbi:hypothetical protein JW979_09935, partial [bacterium]|nr:hypothetical protein [candidate division CSSED10-310 bacterium]
PGNQITLMHGGITGEDKFLGDMWIWNGVDWTRMDPVTEPEARAYHAMTLDAHRSRIVMFGGLNQNDEPLPGTWEYFDADWHLISSSPDNPSPRYGHCMAYDPVHQVTVLFGGYTDEGMLSDETWFWNGSVWTRHLPGSAPSPRLYSAMCYYPPLSGIVLFGGVDANGIQSDMWLWNGTTWAIMTTPGVQPESRGHTLVYESSTEKLLLYGSGNDEFWSYLNGVWQLEPVDIERPEPRSNALMVTCDTTPYVYLYGGSRSGEEDPLFDDLWSFNGLAWQPVQISGNAPPARLHAQAAYNPLSDELVLYGGDNGTMSLDDTWIFKDGDWTLITPDVSPPAIAKGAMAYDYLNDGILLFGGETQDQYLDTTYFFNGTTWSPLSTGQAPSARILHRMTSDRSHNRIWMFGGVDADGYNDELWYWDGSNWNESIISDQFAPVGRIGHGISFLADFNRLVVFGGFIGEDPGYFFNDTWIFDGNQWQLLTQMHTLPSPRGFFGFGAIQSQHSCYLFGGKTTLFADNAETWRLSQIVLPTPTPQPSPTATPSPIPTSTPVPPTPTPTFNSGIDLHLNKSFYLPYDRFLFEADLTNGTSMAKDVDLYIILDVYSYYYFYPNWTDAVNFEPVHLEQGLTERTIFDFEWPYVESTAQGIIFWGAMLEPSSAVLFGDYDYEVFGYGYHATATPTPGATSSPTAGPTIEPTETPEPQPPTPTPTSPPPEMTLYNDDYQGFTGCEDPDIFCFEARSYMDDCSNFEHIADIYNPAAVPKTLFCTIDGAHSSTFELEGSSQFTLQPNQTIALQVRFCPHSPPGDREAYLSVFSSENETVGSCTLKSAVQGK